MSLGHGLAMIPMGRAQVAVLSSDEIASIQGASYQILERGGIKVLSERALRIFEEAGAKIDHETQRAFLEERLVKEAVQKAPKEFTLAARDPKHDLRLPAEQHTYLASDGFPSKVLDLDTQQVRDATLADTRDFVRLSDALPSIDFIWPSVTGRDAPIEMQFLETFLVALRNSSKHVQYQATNPREAQQEIELAAAIAGGREELRKRPLISAVQTIVGPLQLDAKNSEAVIEFAKAGIPVIAYSMAVPGATAPVTLAGTLAVGNAETLASLTLCQLAHPGAPVVYTQDSSPLDMKTGSWASGSPEQALVAIGSAQLGHTLGLPVLTGAFSTTAKVPEFQSAFEKSFTNLAVLGGSDLIPGAGGLNCSSYLSLLQLILDAEIFAGVRRGRRGIEVDPETIALETILKVGAGKQFIGERHTLRHFRTALWFPELADRASLDQWEKAGAQEMPKRARGRLDKILADHRPEPIDPAIDAQLSALMEQFRAENVRPGRRSSVG